MPVGLTIAAATFSEIMDRIFKDEEGCLWYVNDIRIYGGEIEAERHAYVVKILQQCVNDELAVNLTKSEFHARETIFLGQIVNGSQVHMDPAKLETISKWPVPTNEK